MIFTDRPSLNQPVRSIIVLNTLGTLLIHCCLRTMHQQFIIKINTCSRR
nr:MAG TPA: hypothetical protein [Bacteriophage sp.]